MNINFQYLAGLLDADGNIYCDYRTSTNGNMYPIIKVSITQKHPSVLFYTKTFLDTGSLYYNKKTDCSTLYLIGNQSIDFLKKTLPFLIIKKSQAKFCLDIINEGSSKYDLSMIKKVRETNSKKRHELDEFEFTKEWFGGFFDGDGYIGAYKPRTTKKPKITAAITFDKKDPYIGKILTDNFGGQTRKASDGNLQWYKNINSREMEFLEDLQSNCIVKKPQVEKCNSWLKDNPTHTRGFTAEESTLSFINELKKLKTIDANLLDSLISNVDNYQIWTRTTATYPKESELEYLTIGLAGECGEICNKIKKVIRGDYTIDSIKPTLLDELGDVLYYIARMADCLGFKLSDVMDSNNSKLDSRQNRGVISGDGDKR